MDFNNSSLDDSSNYTKVWKNSAENKLALKPTTRRSNLSASSESIFSPVKTNDKTIFDLSGNTEHMNNLCNFYRAENTGPIFTSRFNDSAVPKKPLSIVSKLNDEILLLSEELKQANEVISCLNKKLIESDAANEDIVKNLKTDHELQIAKLHQDFQQQSSAISNNIRLLEKQHSLEISKLKQNFQYQIDQKNISHELIIDKIVCDHKKQMLLLENQFIEVIINLNHKFIKEIESLSNSYTSIIKPIKIDGTGTLYSDKDSEDGSTLYSPGPDFIKKTDAFLLSPSRSGAQSPKKSDEPEYDLELSLRKFFGHINSSIYHGQHLDLKAQSKSSFLPAVLINTTSMGEILKKKNFSLMRDSWKQLKKTNKDRKIKNKKIIKKYIEAWQKETHFAEDKLIESFYHWRGLCKMEKIYKLKQFKDFFWASN